jgi:tripartite-type tricarboxylate transporter receptor subunit TctC
MRLTFAALALVASSTVGWAQGTYPVKPITMIVPFTAGGASDIIARLVGKSLSATLGQQVIIENLGGAGGTTGSARVAKAEPDGYTLLLHQLALAATATLYKSLPYKVDEAFIPIGLISTGPYIVTARAGFPANTPAEFLQYVKKENGKVTMAHSGIGSGSHLCITLLGQAIGVEFNQIAYRGSTQSTQDLLSGNIDLYCEQALTALPHLETKKIKAIAITSLTQLEQLPDVPTLDKSGLKGFDLANWQGLYAPKGTPPDVIEKINAALQKALAEKEIQEKFSILGTQLFPATERTPVAHAAKFQAELVRWADVTKKAGIQPQ